MVSLKMLGLHDLEKCPHCGKDANFELSERAKEPDADFLKRVKNFDNSNAIEYFATLTCDFCKKTIFAHHTTAGERQCLHLYPSKAQIQHIPSRIIKNFPNFIEIYEQALQAKASGLDHLAGAGLRKAVEFLVTDYLIQIQNKTIDELKNVNLHDRIKLLDESTYAAACLHIARIFGNNELHYFNNCPIDFTEAKECIDTTCILMDSRLAAAESGKRYEKLTPIKP